MAYDERRASGTGLQTRTVAVVSLLLAGFIRIVIEKLCLPLLGTVAVDIVEEESRYGSLKHGIIRHYINRRVIISVV